MRKSLFFILVFALLFMIVPVKTQAQDAYRSQGLFMRPELYSAVAVEIGYQINPFFQISGGFGVEIDITGESRSLPEMLLGIRLYTSEKKWAAFFDYHLGFLFFDGLALPVHRLSLGPSVKNFDIGLGVIYSSLDGESFFGPCLTIGYNFRVGNKEKSETRNE